MQYLIIFFFLASQALHAQNPPNILWIVCEDISPTLSMYGDSTAKTPNLAALAKESMVYDYAFAPVGVCAPTRSCIITGMYPTSIGTMHMRTGKDIQSWGKRRYKEHIPIADIQGDSIQEYAAVLPMGVKCFTEHLRATGYFCTNNQKTDYQFAAPLTAWDENNNKAHWRHRPAGKPFFSVFNIEDTHESRLWKNADLPLTVAPESVPVPPYLPDNEISRTDIARHYSNVEIMDAKVGKIIQQLKEDGLYDSTIIFFYSDHGGPLPRQKREIYDSGLKVPLMIKGIKSPNGRTDRMVSFVDLAPTVLSLAGIQPPNYLEGKAFLGKYETENRDYIFGSSDRFDEYTDRIRVVRNQQFLYVRNFFPEMTKYKDVSYRKQIPMMKNMLSLEDDKQLNAQQTIWFGDKMIEELYDCTKDPHNLHNLAEDTNYHEVLQKMRTLLLEQMSQSPDWGQIPEAQMIDMMWPAGQQPSCVQPNVILKNEKVTLNCATQGASIAYLITDQPVENFDMDAKWQLYTTPISIEKGKFLYAVAERIGYQMSPVLMKKFKIFEN